MVLQRRRLLVGVLLLTLGVLPANRSLSQVAGLSKLPWGSIFGGLQVALASIPLLADWLLGASSDAKAALCKLSTEAISNLEFRCLSVALALDSTGEGPVVPPQEGTIGIIPALSEFSVKQDQATVSATRDACFRILDASENLLNEIDRGKWLALLGPAGVRTEDIETLSENLKYAIPRMGDFLWIYNAKLPVTPYDVEAARNFSKQLAEMPASARKANAAIRRIQEKRQKTSCPL